jgi:hypothetical protein
VREVREKGKKKEEKKKSINTTLVDFILRPA